MRVPTETRCGFYMNKSKKEPAQKETKLVALRPVNPVGTQSNIQDFITKKRKRELRNDRRNFPWLYQDKELAKMREAWLIPRKCLEMTNSGNAAREIGIEIAPLDERIAGARFRAEMMRAQMPYV